MKTYQRKTKNVSSSNWQSNRADFNLQCQEAYSNMNCQVMSSKMPAQSNPLPQQRMMK